MLVAATQSTRFAAFTVFRQFVFAFQYAAVSSTTASVTVRTIHVSYIFTIKCKAHLHFRGNTVLFIPVTAVLPLYPLPIRSIHRVSKNKQNYFCYNYVKLQPNPTIFGTKMANCLRLYEVHSFSTSPNSRQCTTVLNADVPNCYITL